MQVYGLTDVNRHTFWVGSDLTKCIIIIIIIWLCQHHWVLVLLLFSWGSVHRFFAESQCCCPVSKEPYIWKADVFSTGHFRQQIFPCTINLRSFSLFLVCSPCVFFIPTEHHTLKIKGGMVNGFLPVLHFLPAVLYCLYVLSALISLEQALSSCYLLPACLKYTCYVKSR